MSFFKQIFHRFKGSSKGSRADEPAQLGAVDPKKILFSTPTLENTMAAFSDQTVSSGPCQRMHEDDWRQFEFIEPKFCDELVREIAAIDKIWQTESVPLGEGMTAFRQVHLRELIAQPLNIAIELPEFERLMGVKTEPVALLFDDHAMQSVYAAAFENVFFYADIQQNHLTALGIQPSGRFALPEDAAGRLGKFLMDHELILVHWRSRTVFKTPEAAMNYLSGRAEA